MNLRLNQPRVMSRLVLSRSKPVARRLDTPTVLDVSGHIKCRLYRRLSRSAKKPSWFLNERFQMRSTRIKDRLQRISRNPKGGRGGGGGGGRVVSGNIKRDYKVFGAWRIDARRKNASALRLRFSQSLASLRQRLSQAMVRSTTQRRGSTTVLGVIGALDDFSFELRQEFRERPLEFGSLIAAVGK